MTIKRIDCNGGAGPADYQPPRTFPPMFSWGLEAEMRRMILWYLKVHPPVP